MSLRFSRLDRASIRQLGTGQAINEHGITVERLANGDPRLSLQERYGDHQGFVAAMKFAARDLVAERFMLQEDANQFAISAFTSNVLR